MKIILILIITIALIIVAILVYTYFVFPNLGPIVRTIEVKSSISQEKIYIKKKQWGLTGDAQVIVVSESSEEEFEPNENTEYVYRGLLPFFYKFENDTLNLYVRKKSGIPNNKFKVIINQIELTNSQMMELMTTYEQKGLKKIH